MARYTAEYLDSEPIDAPPLPDAFSWSRLRRSLLLIAAIVAVVVALITLVPGLASVRDRFEGGKPAWLVLAAALQVLSCASYVVAFRSVFCQQMSWRTSTEIGLAELAANSPFSVGGAGGRALGAWILRRGGVSAGHIARRTVAFFLLTSLANVTLLIAAGLALTTGVLSGAPSLLFGVVPAAAGLAAIGLALAAKPVAGRLARWTGRPRVETALSHLANGVSEAVMLLRTRQPEIAAGTFGYVLFDVAMLGVCFTAFGNEVPPAGVLVLAYLIGQLGGLIPIPGGIGGVDGGLIGTLVLYGVDPADAAVAVLAYRGLLLTIPAALGLPALAIIRRRLRTEEHDIAACSPGEEVDVLGRGPVRLGVPPRRPVGPQAG
ncbi:MAG: lysylphosphatidylglycerol synthase transmembrane domain-containing protein [Solirubrobacteraceae bacterium]